MRSWLALPLLLLWGCSEQNNYINDYVERLENVLERDAIETETKIPAPFPKSRQLGILLPTPELNIREFLSLRHCKLHTVIAHRNSQLGKVASASQTLFSDLNIIRLGPRCVEQLDDSQLASKLMRFLKQKEQNLNTVLWYALLAQGEHASFWRRHYDYEKFNDVSLELSQLSEFSNQVLSGETAFTKQQNNNIERHLGRLRFGGGGWLVDEYAKLITGLTLANSIVQQRLDHPLCLSNSPTQKAHFFENVVNKFFIKQVQLHSVKLNQHAKQLMTPFDRLEKPLLQYSSPEYRAWAKKRNQILIDGQSATLQHARLLQKLYRQCGLTPG